MDRIRLFSNGCSIAVMLMLLVVLAMPTANGTEVMTVQTTSSDYRIIDRDEGQMIEMNDFGYLTCPGKPMLPAKNFLIALPPGARVQSLEVTGIGEKQLPGSYQILPTSIPLPLLDPLQFPELLDKTRREWEENNQAVYSTDNAYPAQRGKLTGSGTLRKYSYASVSFYPFSYHPQSGTLIHYHSAQIRISYDLPPAGSSEAQKAEEMKWDDLADQRAQALFFNYNEMESMYHPSGPRPKDPQQTYDYVIITTITLQSAVAASDFVDWKTSLGYNVRFVLITDSEITSQPGADLQEQIRNFLRSYYISWGIEYVLIVGDNATIPMRYCYPDPTNHWNDAGNPNASSGENPTDYYYADLSDPDEISWDSDGDGYPCEYGEDDPDFLAEVYVGRIPTNNTSRITYALNKSVTFEQDTGVWKNSALHAGTFWWFENEDYAGHPLMDGATCLSYVESDIFTGWNISHYSEQAGLCPSVYPWPALTEAAFTTDWRTGQYSVVNWGAHGWTSYAARKYWHHDDGDGVPEGNEMAWPDLAGIYSNLDDDYPGFFFPISCLIGCPEPNSWGNLGIDLLTEPGWGASIGVVSATRIVWGMSDWPTTPGLAESYLYEFYRHMVDGPGGPEKAGEALYDGKFFTHDNYPVDHYAEHWDLVTYNLYGDPSLVREGISQFTRGDCNDDGIVDASDVVFLINYLFQEGPAPDPLEAGDANSDSVVGPADVVYLINYLFKQGPPPCVIKDITKTNNPTNRRY
jgi:hypothetical protein